MSLTTTVLCDKCGTLAPSSFEGFNPNEEGIDRSHYCRKCVQETLYKDLQANKTQTRLQQNVNKQ